MMSWRLVCGVVVTAAVGSSLVVRADDSADLLRLVPPTANMISVIRVKQLQSTQAGKEAIGEANAVSGEILGGAASIPPNATTVVRARHIQPEVGRTIWTLSLAKIPGTWTLKNVAAQQGGILEQLSERPVATVGGVSVLSQLPGGVLAEMTPVSRHDMGSYIRFATSQPVVQSRKDAASDPGAPKAPRVPVTWAEEVASQSNSSVVMALDLRDVFEINATTAYLEATPAFRGTTKEAEGLARQLTGLQGLMLEINVTDQMNMRLAFLFSTTPPNSAVKLKDVLQTYLEDHGAVIDDFDNLKASIEPKKVVLEGPVTTSGVLRMLSFLTGPDSSGMVLASSNVSPEEQKLVASRAYYQAVNRLTNDLYDQASKMRNYEKTALWHEQYAAKIVALPIQGVDDDLLKYGRTIAARLNQLAASLRGVPLEVNRVARYAREDVSVTPPTYFQTFGYNPFPYAGAYTNVGYGSAWAWGGGGGGGMISPGYVNVKTNYSEIRGKQADAVAKGAKEREALWQGIAEDKATIREEMLKKYNMDFDAPPRAQGSVPPSRPTPPQPPAPGISVNGPTPYDTPKP